MRKDRGMTILEVVVALTILMIGVGFVYSGNKMVYKYKARQELRQQMFFYAAGQLEAYLERGSTVSETLNGISVDLPQVTPVNSHLETVTITVRSTTFPDINPVVIRTMKVLP